MAKSSIHIQKSVDGAIGHNSREHFSYSVVFVDNEKNECSNSQEKSYKIYRSELEKRAEKYTARTGQKMQKSTVTQLSSIINLEQHHTLKDLEPIKKHLEKIFDTKVYQMAVHRDEGKLISKADKTELYSGKDFFLNTKDNELYFDKKFTQKIDLNDYEIVKNYHAHIEMLGLDSDGNAIRQKMNKVALQQLQTFVANELKMERGKENISYSKDEMKAILEVVGKKTDYESTTLYAKKFNETAKELGVFKEKYRRKDTHIFKDTGSDRESAKREVFKEVLAVQEETKVLKKENSSLKSQNTKLTNSKAQQKELLTALKLENKELQSKLSSREEHAQREALNTKLREEIKVRDVTIEEIQVKFKELEEKFKTTLAQKDKFLGNLQEIGKEIAKEIPIKEIKEIPDAVKTVLTQNKSLQAQKEVLASKVTALELKTAHSSNIAPSDVLTEFKKIQKDEITEKEVKVGVLKSEKIQILENPDSFIKKAWNLISNKYNQLLEEVKALKSENKAMKIELAELKEKAREPATKQQKENLDIFEKIQSEAKRNHEATFLIDKEKETQTTVKIRRDR